MSCDVATTMNIGWPTNCTTPSASTGSSWTIGPQSLTPGMSAAVNTATTPGVARTASKFIDTIFACGFADRPSAACSVPATSGMSSV